MSRPVVTIIDSSKDRLLAMAESFNPVAEVQVAWVKGVKCTVKAYGANKFKDHLTKCDLILCHFGDKSHLKKFDTLLKAVFYGGSGGEDGPVPEGCERIWRSILGISGVLVPEEAQAILDYMNAEERDYKAKPDVLRKDKVVPTPISRINSSLHDLKHYTGDTKEDVLARLKSSFEVISAEKEVFVGQKSFLARFDWVIKKINSADDNWVAEYKKEAEEIRRVFFTLIGEKD